MKKNAVSRETPKILINKTTIYQIDDDDLHLV